jgi:hypothetical protein
MAEEAVYTRLVRLPDGPLDLPALPYINDSSTEVASDSGSLLPNPCFHDHILVSFDAMLNYPDEMVLSSL